MSKEMALKAFMAMLLGVFVLIGLAWIPTANAAPETNESATQSPAASENSLAKRFCINDSGELELRDQYQTTIRRIIPMMENLFIGGKVSHGKEDKFEEFEIYVSARGTWSVIITLPGKGSCVALQGDAWSFSLHTPFSSDLEASEIDFCQGRKQATFDEVYRSLTDRFGEDPVASGFVSKDIKVTFFASRSGGNWTGIISRSDGANACLLVFGYDWDIPEIIDEKKPRHHQIPVRELEA